MMSLIFENWFCLNEKRNLLPGKGCFMCLPIRIPATMAMAMMSGKKIRTRLVIFILYDTGFLHVFRGKVNHFHTEFAEEVSSFIHINSFIHGIRIQEQNSFNARRKNHAGAWQTRGQREIKRCVFQRYPVFSCI